jgi:CheY-like chemotaxis protein/two-component sensor histidine kinase
MGRLLDDLLDVLRITRGKIQLRRELLDLRNIAEQVIESMRPQASEHKLMLNFRPPEGPLPIDGDPTRIEQILRNLLNNAIKYTPQGGSIWVVVDAEPGADGHMEAVIRVRDTGIGIEPQVLEHVFDLFAQAKQSLARTQGGLGIGLTMVKSLAELHGGRSEAFSEGPDQGSEFTVYLPLAAAAEAVPEIPETVSADHATEPHRVLIVDDNEDLVVSLNDLLAAWGYEVRTALDGPRAIDITREWQPDVIVLDIGLPGMDGYEVAERIRREPWGAHISIVALTGYGSEQDRKRAMQAGFNYHLTKPVETDRLRMILHKKAA